MISALQVVSPPSVEPVTLATFKIHARIDDDSNDAVIPGYITAARMLVEKLLGRALIQQQLLWTIAHSAPPTGWPLMSISAALFVLPQWFQPEMLGRVPLTLPRQPVISVDSVGVGCWNETDTMLTTDQYGYDLATARLQLFGPNPLAYGTGHVDITFTAGYGASASSVPQTIVHAITMWATHLYEHRGDEDGGEPPEVVKMLLSIDRQITFGG